MLKNEIIHGYRILEDFKVVGGQSKISFAEKDGTVFFIKEFLNPKYPTPDSPGSERIKAQKRKACEDFETHHKDLNNAIGKSCAGMGGNLVYALDFFREGSSYYKVTEKIDTTSISCTEISKLSLDKILIVAKSTCHSIRILHNLNIVHGDLKPDNLLIKEASSGLFVTKLIDFDDSYFEGKPTTDRESLVGTPEYYSPEQANYIMDEDEEISGTTLTCKSDIFTLGIVFCEYFTGEKPVLPKKYDCTWTCVQDGKSIRFKRKIDSVLESLIRKMLSCESKDRPSITEVFEVLKNFGTKSGSKEEKTDTKTTYPGSPEPEPSSGGSFLRGKLLGTVKPDKTMFPDDEPTKPPSGGSFLRGKGLGITK